MVEESIRAGQEPAAASGVMTPAGALQALADGVTGAIAVAGTAHEVSEHLKALAGTAAGAIASIAITDAEPLTVSKEDFRVHATAYARILQTITARPLLLNFH
jgi:hypothetical protein